MKEAQPDRLGLSRTGEYEDLIGHEKKICFGECPV